MLHTTPRFASAFRAFRGHALCPALCPNSRLGSALPFEGLPPLPWRASLRSELYCLGSSSLIRPHASHWWAHPDFTALPLIQECLRCAGAPNPHFSQLGRREMKFVRIGSCEMISRGAVV